MGGGEHMKFYPYEKKGGGAENCLAILKGWGATKSFGVVFMWQLEVLAKWKGGGRTKFPIFKRGGAKSVTMS